MPRLRSTASNASPHPEDTATILAVDCSTGGGDAVRADELDGEYDDLPEQAFLMVGKIEEVVEKAKTL